MMIKLQLILILQTLDWKKWTDILYLRLQTQLQHRKL
jgi:hypothetical protein